MTTRQKVFAIVIAVSIFLLILELVRRGKLKEEYSWLWLLAGVIIILPVIKYEILAWLTQTIGAVVHTTALFLFAILFLILVGIFFSIRLSSLSTQVKNLIQELAIARLEIDELKRGKADT